MFGIELAHNRSFALRLGLNEAVFTWHGVTVVLRHGSSEMNGDETTRLNK